MQPKRFGALSSSINPNELAMTVVGIVKLVAGVLVATGLLTVVDANTTLETVPVLVASGYATLGAAETVFGIIRKVVVAFTARF